MSGGSPGIYSSNSIMIRDEYKWILNNI
jgi:hypothetical protein